MSLSQKMTFPETKIHICQRIDDLTGYLNTSEAYPMRLKNEAQDKNIPGFINTGPVRFRLSEPFGRSFSFDNMGCRGCVIGHNHAGRQNAGSDASMNLRRIND